MAAIGFFDASQVQPGGSYEVVPAGEYRAILVDSVMENTKSGSGQFLKLTLQIIDGPHAGVTLFDRLNLVNANPKAVEIAQRTLSAICHAVGVLQVQDSAQLHNRPLVARVAYKEGGEPDGRGGVYGPSNEIKTYKAISQAAPQQAPVQQPAFQQSAAAYQAPTQPAFQQPPAQQAAPAAAGVPPWMAGKAA
jgi:hypothetical protein